MAGFHPRTARLRSLQHQGRQPEQSITLSDYPLPHWRVAHVVKQGRPVSLIGSQPTNMMLQLHGNPDLPRCHMEAHVLF